MSQYVLALDQGTTSSRAILFDSAGLPVAKAQQELDLVLPAPGHVEIDPELIWSSQLEVARDVLRRAAVDAGQLAAIGIANQRETAVLWWRESGLPACPAIVWQSRVSAPICERLRREGHEDVFRRKTGLLLDPYFSGTKIAHLLQHNPSWREAAEQGELLFGTVDSWLLWRLTDGACHATDVSNASRTLLLDIHRCQWDEPLCRLLDIPPAMLPQVRASSGLFAEAAAHWFGGAVPIAGIAGDQQAATFGQACFEIGSVKNTYGTGAFLLMNTGPQPVVSQHRLLTTVGWQLGDEVTYCLEGSVFVAGAAVQWLRDQLRLAESSHQVQKLAESVDDSGGVVFVPAFVGLGTPHWDPYARGAIFGITSGTTAAHIARAAIEAMALQSHDVLTAMQDDFGSPPTLLKADGGAAQNDLLLQLQANLLGVPVGRPEVWETTALGAAYLAGLAVGYWDSQERIRENWRLGKQFIPVETPHNQHLLTNWRKALRRCVRWAED